MNDKFPAQINFVHCLLFVGLRGEMSQQSAHGGRRLYLAGSIGVAVVRGAVQQFVIQYNQHWRLGKLGYKSPAQARAKWRAETMAA